MMSKNRLVHVTSSLQMGGAESILFTIVKHLQATFDQMVVYFHDGPFVQKIEQLGVRTIKISGYFCLYDPIFFWRLFNELKACNPDVIHSLLWAANVSSRLCAYALKIPMVNVYHNNVEQDGLFRIMLDRLTASMCDQPVAVSEQVVQSVKNYWQPAKQIEVITNGINVPQVELNIAKKDLGIADDNFVIGAVGRFVPVKSFDILLKAAARVILRHAHVQVILVGGGQEEGALRQLAHDLKIADRVHFVVGVSAINYYPLFDCFVQSSSKEGVSLALLEAMFFECPCVVMGDFFVHSVITHGVDGLVCETGNVEQLASIICSVVEQKDYVVNNLTKNAKEAIVSRYTSLHMNQKYEKLFSKLCSKSAM